MSALSFHSGQIIGLACKWTAELGLPQCSRDQIHSSEGSVSALCLHSHQMVWLRPPEQSCMLSRKSEGVHREFQLKRGFVAASWLVLTSAPTISLSPPEL